MKCNNCGYDDPNDDRFCSECGAPKAPAPPAPYVPGPGAYLPPAPGPAYSSPPFQPQTDDFNRGFPLSGVPPAPPEPPFQSGRPVDLPPRLPSAIPLPLPGPSFPDFARLVGTDGPVQGEEFPLSRQEMTIGRRSDCDIVVADPSVSRLHATVRQGPGAVQIEDAGSANGTWVNGVRINGPHVLSDRDVIQIGKAAFSLRAPAQREPEPLGGVTMVESIGKGPSSFGGQTEAMPIQRDEGSDRARRVPEFVESDAEPRFDAVRTDPPPRVQPEAFEEASPLFDRPVSGDYDRQKGASAESATVQSALDEIQAIERELGPFIERLRGLGETVCQAKAQLASDARARGALSALDPAAREQLFVLVSEYQTNGGAAAYAELERVVDLLRARPGDPVLAARLLDQLPLVRRLLERHLQVLTILSPRV
ncbi:MAG: FHA domain-containing protein [Chloroflexi bacterium]|nr:FHA domain-containing protein [Chloroflexota bacterium]